MPRIEIYGSAGSLAVPDPNTFGGPVGLRLAGEAEWRQVPLTHGRTENSRSLGVADMAYALRSGRPHRASGELAYHVLDVMQSFAEASASGRHVDALLIRNQMYALREAKLGADHADTLRSMLLVGESHLALEDYAAAEAILLDRQVRVERNLENLPPQHVTVGIPRLIELYEAWGKPEEAEKWRAKSGGGVNR